MTMPAPPPAGRIVHRLVTAETEVANGERYRAPTAPCCKASPDNDAASGPGNSSGNKVTMVARQGDRIDDVA